MATETHTTTQTTTHNDEDPNTFILGDRPRDAFDEISSIRALEPKNSPTASRRLDRLAHREREHMIRANNSVLDGLFPLPSTDGQGSLAARDRAHMARLSFWPNNWPSLKRIRDQTVNERLEGETPDAIQAALSRAVGFIDCVVYENRLLDEAMRTVRKQLLELEDEHSQTTSTVAKGHRHAITGLQDENRSLSIENKRLRREHEQARQQRPQPPVQSQHKETGIWIEADQHHQLHREIASLSESCRTLSQERNEALLEIKTLQACLEAIPEETPNTDDEQVLSDARDMLQGKHVLIVGGEPRPGERERLEHLFECSVDWPTNNGVHGSINPFLKAAKKPFDLMVFFPRWMSHATALAKLEAQQRGIRVITIAAGRNPKQIARHVIAAPTRSPRKHKP